MKKNILIATTLALAGLPGLWANTAPTVVIHSAAMRPGTTLMDIVFRVNDQDDATVKTRALAFKDGVRSFDSVIRPTTFVEGTGIKIGDAIPANSNHTITWDVAADWDVQLGQVKFEVLAMDSRSLLPLDWVTIPATETTGELTISKKKPSDGEILDAFLWLYASGDPDLKISGWYPNIYVEGTESSGIYSSQQLVYRNSINSDGIRFLFKKMNLNSVDIFDKNLADLSRIALTGSDQAVSSSYEGMSVLQGSRSYYWNQVNLLPIHFRKKIKSFSLGQDHGLIVRDNGLVYAWGGNEYGQSSVPNGLDDVIAVTAGAYHSLALKQNGTVVAWGANWEGQINVPSNLINVKSIFAGTQASFAVLQNGSVVAWGGDSNLTTIPPTLNNVKSLAVAHSHVLALTEEGVVLGWGANDHGQINIPPGLSGVKSIAAGSRFSVALKNDGSLISWGEINNNTVEHLVELNDIKSIAVDSWNNMPTLYTLHNNGSIIASGIFSSGYSISKIKPNGSAISEIKSNHGWIYWSLIE